jgi:hypothetical protein
MKNSNDTIENRNRDLPACSAVPQPTVPPRALIYKTQKIIEQIKTFVHKICRCYKFRCRSTHTTYLREVKLLALYILQLFWKVT